MHWVRLGDIASKITKGTTPTSIGYDFVDEGINFIKIESITENGTFLQNKFAHITSECNEKLGRSQLNVNDILFSIAGAIGRTAIVSEDILPANTNQAIAIIRVPEGSIDYSFLMYALESPAFRKQYESQKQGVAQINLSLQNVSDFLIPKFGLDEQRRIAAVLDKVSYLIAKRREQLDKLDELVKARFVEMFGDPINNTKGLPTTPLGEICYLKAGVTTASDEIHSQSKEYSVPCYGGNGIRGYVKEATQRGTYPIIGRQGALCGNVQLAIGEFHATEHAVLVSPIIKTNVIWVYYLLKFMDLYRYHTGAAQPGLAVKTLNMVEIPCADIGLQNEFATFAEQVEKSKLTIQQSLDKLEVLKKALMQQYFG